jgi:hypothetical protein
VIAKAVNLTILFIGNKSELIELRRSGCNEVFQSILVFDLRWSGLHMLITLIIIGILLYYIKIFYKKAPFDIIGHIYQFQKRLDGCGGKLRNQPNIIGFTDNG